ncbi:MAG: hypothetical protein JOZ69_20780 [Myxococcales bacterium]|nr:hypothetical protein [Myxococcales bacterium]
MQWSSGGDAPNPYAAPAAGPTAGAQPWSDARSPLRPAGTGGPWIRWALLSTYVCGLSSVLVGFGLLQHGGDPALAPIGAGLTALGAMCAIAYGVLMLVWVGMSWAMIPPAGRQTRNGTWVSPGRAVGLLFVPFYNLYWVFAQSTGLCDALNRQLEAFGSAKRAPRGLAIAASVVQVVPYANLVLGPWVWLPYVFLVDAAKAAYARAALAMDLRSGAA